MPLHGHPDETTPDPAEQQTMRRLVVVYRREQEVTLTAGDPSGGAS